MTLLRSVSGHPMGFMLERREPRRVKTAALGAAFAILLANACSGDESRVSDGDSGSRADVTHASDAPRRDGTVESASDAGNADGEASSATPIDASDDRGPTGDAGADIDATVTTDARRADDGSSSGATDSDAGNTLAADARDAAPSGEGGGGSAGDGGDARDAAVQPPLDARSEAAVRDAADAAPPAGPRWLVMVAHPDDDILFFNPDVASAIRAGVTVRTLYMTSGDSAMQDWAAREAGVLAATASIAGVAGPWTCQARTLGGHQLQSCTLPGAPRVSAMFLRILDTTLGPLWQLAPGRPFPVGAPTASVTTKDGASTYTRPQLTQMLADIVRDFLPTRLMLMDSTLAYDSDFEHHDHVASGMFGLTAGQADGTVGSIAIYRNYSVFQTMAPQTPTAANLTQAQYQEKVALMATYGLAIDVTNPTDAYNAWCQRQYSISSVTLPPGTLRQSGTCLDVDGTPSDGSAVVLAACTGTAAQTWTVRSDARVVGASGLCLTVAANGSSVVLGTCAGTAPQRWTLFDNGQLRGVEGSCLTATGAAVTVATCGHQGVPLGVAASQTWTR